MRWEALLLLTVLLLPCTATTYRELKTNDTKPACDDTRSVTMHYAEIFENGTAWDPVGGLLYPPGTYWKHKRKSSIVYKGCPCALDRPCLRKCCLLGGALDPDGKCAPTRTHVFSPIVTEDDGSHPRTVNGDEHFAVLYGMRCHGAVVDPDKHPNEEFFVRASDGSLSLPRKSVEWLSPFNYCLDYVHDTGTYLPLICEFENNGVPSNASMWVLYSCALGMLLSTTFLVIAFFAYARTPELRGGLHGKSMMSLLTCLVMGYVFLSMVQLAGRSLTKNNCIASAFVIQFTFQAALFWLNIMCFDIFTKFRGPKLNPSLVRKREEKRFVLYSMYAWGFPLIILVAAVVMDFSPGLSDELLKPKFGRIKCWFSTRSGAFAYFYGPMAMLVLLNLLMLVITTVKIMGTKAETAILRIAGTAQRDENHQKNKQRFNLYLKLFIVMTTNWLVELISWTAVSQNVLWCITDMGNTLQSFFIFMILVWKDGLLQILEDNLKRLTCCTPAFCRRGSDVS